MLWLAALFATGILFSTVVQMPFLVPLILSILLGLISRFQDKTRSTILILASFLACGLFYGGLAEKRVKERPLRKLFEDQTIKSGEPIEVLGWLEDGPQIGIGSVTFTVKIKEISFKNQVEKIDGRIRYFATARDSITRNRYLTLMAGDEVRISSLVYRELRYRNPGGFDSLADMDRKGIDANGRIKSPELLEIVDLNEGFAPLASLWNLRNSIILQISKTFEPNTSGILIASMLGNRSFLTKETANVFREGGTFHILVISGLHITLIGGFLFWLVSLVTRNRYRRFFLTIMPLWVYALIVGGNAPVLRATLMFTVVLMSALVNREYLPLNGFGIAILILLVQNPSNIFNPSFQLTIVSVGAILGIVIPIIERIRAIGSWMPCVERPFPARVNRRLRAFCEALYWNESLWQKTLRESVWTCRIFKSPIAAKLSKYHLQKPIRFLFEGALASSIIQVAMLPLTIFYFHRTGIASVILNFWVGFWMLLLAIFSTLAILLGNIADLFRDSFAVLAQACTWMIVDLPSHILPYSFVTIRIPLNSNRWLYPLYLVPVLILAFLLYRWNPFALPGRGMKAIRLFRLGITAFATILIFQLILIFQPFQRNEDKGKLRLDFIDVGQGDSTLVTFPGGSRLLIDGGGQRQIDDHFVQLSDGEIVEVDPDRRSIGESVVSEFLWEKGIARLDAELATHADADHIQGLISVTKNFRPRTLFIGIDQSGDPYFDELISTLDGRGIGIQRVNSKSRLEIEGVTIQVLNPLRGEKAKSANDDSVAIMLVYGARRFLLAADIERASEQQILDDGRDIRADVLKVAHHGSKTSSTSEFIEAVKPKVAVIPVGRNSQFGHPHDVVLDRLEKARSRILTTGKCGTITIISDGKEINVSTYVKGCS